MNARYLQIPVGGFFTFTTLKHHKAPTIEVSAKESTKSKPEAKRATH
jgi:hypothetical protein